MPVGVPVDGAGGEGCAALLGMATARMPLSLVAVLVLFSPSRFSASLSFSFSVSPSRDLALARSRCPAGVLFVESRDDVLLPSLGEGAVELSVPGRPLFAGYLLIWLPGESCGRAGKGSRPSEEAIEALAVSAMVASLLSGSPCSWVCWCWCRRSAPDLKTDNMGAMSGVARHAPWMNGSDCAAVLSQAHWRCVSL